MGFARAWLPSRRSVESQRGAEVVRLFGHWRTYPEGKGTSRYGTYLVEGSPLELSLIVRTER
jgi:hypothetical protein